MPANAEDLYHDQILAHDRAPRNEGPLDGATHSARLSNPICGDRVQIELRVEAGRVGEAGFRGRGCALCRASASILTDTVRGMSKSEATATAQSFSAWLHGEAELDPRGSDLRVFSGLLSFPGRRRCATLPWEALVEAWKEE